MTSLSSDHRAGIKIHEESPTHDFCAQADNVNLKIQSKCHSSETMPRVLHVDSAVSVRDPLNGTVNSLVSLTEDFVNFTFSFPKLYFSELSYKVSEEMKKPETMAIESTPNSSKQSDCQKSQSKGTSNCTNMNTPTNQDLSNIHEMKNRENVTCEFPKGISSSNDTASVESEDESQTSSEMIENSKSTCAKRTLTTTSNLKNLDASESCRNVQISVKNSTAEETDDCCINTDLIESKAEVAINSEGDSQNVQILGITNKNVNTVQKNFEESSFGKYDSTEREATKTAETLTTGSGINHQECINQIHTKENLENISQASTEILNLVENEESEYDKCSFKDAESGEDTNSSQININFNKSKLKEFQSTWQELFPFQKIKKIPTNERKFATSVHHTAKFFTFEISEKLVAVKVTAKPDADISVEVVTLNSFESCEIPSTYKNILDKEENVQNSEKFPCPIDPNEECHMQSEYPDKIVNDYPNVESDPNTVKESNLEADNTITKDFTDIKTDPVIAKDGLEISKKSPEVYLKPIADESHEESGLTIVRKSSVPLELLEENVQNSEKLLGPIDPNEECHMQSEYPDKIVNDYPNVGSDPETVKEPNSEADSIITIDFSDIETDLAIAKDGLGISKKSLEVYLKSDESHAETDLTIVRKSSVSLELLEESSKHERSDYVSVRAVQSSESGVVEESESEFITAEVTTEAESESSALNESSKIKPNQMEPVDFMDYDVYPAVVKDKLHDTKIRRECSDVMTDLLEGSVIPEHDSVTESMDDFTTGESGTVAPTDSPKSVLNFAKEGPDLITLSVTSGESRPEADRDAPDGKSKTVTKKISPRNEFDMMQPCGFPYDEPVSVLASECPEHSIVPVTRNTLQENAFPSIEVCLGDSVSETVNVLDENKKNCANKLQENKSIPICANELPDIKSNPSSYYEELEDSDLKYVAQLPECEIIKIIANKVDTIESINIDESQTDTDSEHSSLNLQFSPDEFRNNKNKDREEEIYKLDEVCSPHEALSEKKDNGTEIKQNSSHKKEQFTKHKLQRIENFEVDDPKLEENETSYLSVDPRTFSNFNTSPLKSRTNGDIDDVASNICENDSLSKIKTESTNSEYVHEELENDIKKQVASVKRGKKTSENKVGVKVETTKKSNKGGKIAKGIPKVFSNLISDEVDAAPTRLRTKHYPPTSIAKNVIPEDFQVTQDKIYKGSGEGVKDQDSGDSSANTFPVKRSLRSRSQVPTSGTSQNVKKLNSRSRKSSADTEKNAEVESSVTPVTRKKAQTSDIKFKEHLAVSVRSSPRKATRSTALDLSQSAEIQEESSSTPKKKNIRTSKETVSESKAKGISNSNTSTPATARSNSTATRENETLFLSVDSETSNLSIFPSKSETNRDIDDCQSYISENESLSSIETEYATSEHTYELKSDIKKQVASLKRGKRPSENKVGVKVETSKNSTKESKTARGIPNVFSNLLTDEVDAAPTRLRIKHYPATPLAKGVIPENSQVSQDKARNLFGKDSKDKNEDSSISKSPLRRSLRSRIQDPTPSTSQSIKKPDTLSQRSSGGTGKISKSFSQVESSVTRKKQVQTPDIKLKEHIAVATRSTPRSSRYNVLDHTQSEEESNSTTKNANIRTSNRIASANKSKDRSILSTSTTSASSRSNVNASTTTTRKTRTKD